MQIDGGKLAFAMGEAMMTGDETALEKMRLIHIHLAVKVDLKNILVAMCDFKHLYQVLSSADYGWPSLQKEGRIYKVLNEWVTLCYQSAGVRTFADYGMAYDNAISAMGDSRDGSNLREYMEACAVVAETYDVSQFDRIPESRPANWQHVAHRRRIDLFIDALYGV